jgi:hypothetical protein
MGLIAVRYFLCPFRLEGNDYHSSSPRTRTLIKWLTATRNNLYTREEYLLRLRNRTSEGCYPIRLMKTSLYRHRNLLWSRWVSNPLLRIFSPPQSPDLPQLHYPFVVFVPSAVYINPFPFILNRRTTGIYATI